MDQFFILDAKYYNAQLAPGVAPKGQPGIESITKQYLYQLAYQKFITDHEFKSVKNCFLMPTENQDVEDYGEASMEMLTSLGLQNIKVRFCPLRWYTNTTYWARKWRWGFWICRRDGA